MRFCSNMSGVVLAIALTVANVSANGTTLVNTSGECKQALSHAKSSAVFLTANDSVFVRLVEDSLGICLANAGLTVTNRETLEKKLGEQVNQRQKESSGTTINALEIGKSVQADVIVTGTAVVLQEEKRPMVQMVSFQLLDVRSEKTLISVVFDYEQPLPISTACEEFVKLVTQAR